MSSTQSQFSDFRVLLVEDDEIMRLSLADRLELEGIPVVAVAGVASAVDMLNTGNVDLVVSDIRLPDGSGRDLFEKVMIQHPGTPMIMMTAFGTVSEAVALVKAGAVDYLTKPFELDAFVKRVIRSLSRLADIRLPEGLMTDLDGDFSGAGGVLGRSPQMRRTERLISQLGNVDSSVLVTGESGVGKEVVANLIHANSTRAGKPFVTVNCAAIPETLFESELFGHEKGSFTGADKRRIGRFERANGGTIFLDEIAEIQPEFQVKLLRVLQERKLERVGGRETIELDVRVIAATQVDLEVNMNNGQFRSDLYWRLNVIHVNIPPLRERTADILPLSHRFLVHFARDMNKAVTGFSAAAEACLVSMSYPGNIRELRNVIERAVALCSGARVEEHDLKSPVLDDGSLDEDPTEVPLRNTLKKAERIALLAALYKHDWVISQAADALGISRKNLWEKMRSHNIKKGDEPQQS